MDYVSKHQHAPPFLVCPNAKFRDEEEEFRWTQFGEPPSLPGLYDGSPPFDKLVCPFCWKTIVLGSTYHSCKQCWDTMITKSKMGYGYHKECLQPILKHSYHPRHSLRPQVNQLIGSHRKICSCCSDVTQWVYHCSICDFTLSRDCARKPPLLAIHHPKRHKHTLLFLPRKNSLICDVCALSDHTSLIYSCTRCDFVVHKYCLYLPWVIRISRHQHRVSFTSSLTPEKLLCGVCRGKIDTNYGRYFCVKGCNYSVHSKCATRKDVWDGKDLEGKAEDAYEDIKSFYAINDGIIQHFSHQNHHMKLDEETNREFGENKCCQACTLPICDDVIYKCMQCDFILHQVCAHLPQKKQHAIHPHLLTLVVCNQNDLFICAACDRFIGNGLMYKCYETGCTFILDVRCASLSEPLDYWCHPHSLFLTSSLESQQTCSICRKIRGTCLNCGECDYVLCFECATLPKKLRYKHDEHFLILSYDHKDEKSHYWCDICEEEANPTKGIYICNECSVTLHIKCLLGEDGMYVMPRARGGTIDDVGEVINILPNNRLTRNGCMYCHKRCKHKAVYRFHGNLFCSVSCLLEY